MPRATGREQNNQRETPSTAGTANTAAAVPAPARWPQGSPRPRLVRTAALVLANALEVALTWWVLREATTRRRPASAAAGALWVALLVAANALQTGLTWWIYRRRRARARPDRPTIEASVRRGPFSEP
jgi:hypothetical protein